MNEFVLDNVKILIDIGFSYNYLKEKLESININPKDIDYIFFMFPSPSGVIYFELQKETKQ